MNDIYILKMGDLDKSEGLPLFNVDNMITLWINLVFSIFFLRFDGLCPKI